MCVPRGWKIADAVEATCAFLAQSPPRHATIRELMGALGSDDPYTRRCAADLSRRVSAREPGILKAHVGRLIDLAVQLPDAEWQTRVYILQAAGLNAAMHKDRARLASLVLPMARDERIAVRTIALEVLGRIAVAEPRLARQVLPLLEEASDGGTYATRSRAREMLPIVLKGR